MRIPKEIREKIEQRNELSEEMEEWLKENTDIVGCDIEHAYITDELAGFPQRDGEYCNQRILGEDWFVGEYYWKMDNGKFLCVHYET